MNKQVKEYAIHVEDAKQRTLEDVLLPCPFCGGEAHTIESARYGKPWGVRCECGAFLGFEYTEAEAIEAWNARTWTVADNDAEVLGESEG